MLCSKKTFNFESFEIPLLEMKHIFIGVYPHQTHAPYTPRIPPNVIGHIGPSFPQGVIQESFKQKSEKHGIKIFTIFVSSFQVLGDRWGKKSSNRFNRRSKLNF